MCDQAAGGTGLAVEFRFYLVVHGRTRGAGFTEFDNVAVDGVAVGTGEVLSVVGQFLHAIKKCLCLIRARVGGNGLLDVSAPFSIIHEWSRLTEAT